MLLATKLCRIQVSVSEQAQQAVQVAAPVHFSLHGQLQQSILWSTIQRTTQHCVTRFPAPALHMLSLTYMMEHEATDRLSLGLTQLLHRPIVMLVFLCQCNHSRAEWELGDRRATTTTTWRARTDGQSRSRQRATRDI